MHLIFLCNIINSLMLFIIIHLIIILLFYFYIYYYLYLLYFISFIVNLFNIWIYFIVLIFICLIFIFYQMIQNVLLVIIDHYYSILWLHRLFLAYHCIIIYMMLHMNFVTFLETFLQLNLITSFNFFLYIFVMGFSFILLDLI